ncbi:hypothetical protein DRE_06505 [Drechslerella stenobrocha 248]|uniref:Pyridoxal phosphate homeostasis protein n=1 Tax=Drechslerella stenobrocha 248 TaxID=1043628 RepID=W7HX90_9PEZI|nr:hypothetical protein DRE_06505 [Drechslerella stenobrocha 248]
MSDAEVDGSSAAEALEGLYQKLQDDPETQERARELAENIREVRARMVAAATATSTGRSQGDEGPLLIAVSKLKRAVDILALHVDGQEHFGENYAQELSEKQAILPRTIQWHFIGTLQSSAISKLARIPNLHAIHSVDSVKKAHALNRNRPADCAPLRVFVQVNTSGEESKSGLPPFSEALWEVVRAVRKDCPKLLLDGLMTIGAIARSQAAKEGEENEDFVTLVAVARGLQQRIKDEEGADVALRLSMGMSDDFENAIGMGASCVRVGSSIFGARPKKADATVL